MDGSSPTSLQPDANNIWDLFSQINQGMPRQVENRRNEELSMPTPVKESDSSGPDEGAIIDILGSLVAGPRAGIASVVGGGVEAGKQLYQHVTGSTSAPQTSGEAATRIGEKALEYGIGTKIGQKVGEGIGALGRKIFQKPMTQGAEQAQKFAAEGMPLGGQQMAPQNPLPLTPAQMTENTIYGVMENVGKGSIFGGGPLNKFQANNEELTKRTLEKFVDGIGQNLDKEQLGQMFVMVNRGDLRIAQAPAKALYSAIENAVKPTMVERTRMVPSPHLLGANGQPVMTTEKYMDAEGGAFIDLRGLKQWAKPIAERAEATANLGTDITGGALAKRVMAMDDFVPYAAAKDLREVSRSLSAEFKINNKTAPAIGVARHMEGTLTKSIDDGLGRFDPNIQSQWREANKIYAQASSKYDNTFIRHLLKVATDKEGGLPEQMFDMVVKPQNVSTLRRARAAINAETSAEGKQVWDSFGTKALQTAMDRATNKDTQRIDFQSLSNFLFGKTEGGERSAMGMKVMRELYSPQQIEWLQKTLNLGIQQQKGNPTDVGRMLIQMKTGGAIADLTKAGLFTLGVGGGAYYGGAEGAVGGGAAVLLGPEILAYAMTHPDSAKWFVRGMITPAESAEGKSLGKEIAKDLGLWPGENRQSSILGRMVAQRMGYESRERLKSEPSKEQFSLPPIPTQMQGVQTQFP